MKIFALLLGFNLLVHAVLLEERFEEERELEVKIIEKVFRDLLSKEEVFIYVIGSRKEEFIKSVEEFSDHLKPVKDCKKGEILFIAGLYRKEIPPDCRGMLIFGSRREYIYRFPNSIGSFYWRKGRPNLTIIRERLKKWKMKLPKEYDQFIESLDESKRRRSR